MKGIKLDYIFINIRFVKPGSLDPLLQTCLLCDNYIITLKIYFHKLATMILLFISEDVVTRFDNFYHTVIGIQFCDDKCFFLI